MRTSDNIPLEFNCESLGIKNFPIYGYPFNVYKENYEHPIYKREIGKKITPSQITVNKYSHPSPVFNIPRYRLNYARKNVTIPVLHKVPKIVEIPEIREIAKVVDVVKVVDVPVEQVRYIPKLKINEIEKIRHIPGPIEYVDITQEHVIHKPYKKILEKIYEIPEIEDIEIEVPIYVPTPVGPPEDIHVSVPLPYDVPQFCFKPDKNIPHNIALMHNNVNNIPKIYLQNERFNNHLPKFNIPSKINKTKYSSPPKEYTNKNVKTNEYNVYYNMEYDKNDNNVTPCFDNYDKQNINNSPKENINYHEYNNNYDGVNGISQIENSAIISGKNDNYHYSYSDCNNYNENNANKNNVSYNQEERKYSTDYENNEECIYDEFNDSNSNDNKYTTELIVKRKKNF